MNLKCPFCPGTLNNKTGACSNECSFSHPNRPWKIGERVEKVRGYKFPGIIIARGKTKAGEIRYMVEMDSKQFAGMLHIFNGSQLRLRK